jgi:hypothetical protein
MRRDWVKGGGSAKGNFWLDSTLENRTNRKPDPDFGFQSVLCRISRESCVLYASRKRVGAYRMRSNQHTTSKK